MNKEIAVLFDLDGVIIDTEPQYDVFWKKTSEKYHLGDNLEQRVKGITLPNIMAQFFPNFAKEEQEKIKAANRAFELQMDMIPIPGALEFLEELEKEGIKMGLVTSSDDEKLEMVFQQLPIKKYFDSIVSADRITQGKPDPMCYLLAAKDLDIEPFQCFVLEDSFNGIKSGNAAGMKVIGLSTTNSEESIRDQVIKVIPDFQNFKVQDLLAL